MPPRVRLTDPEAALLPRLLAVRPRDPASFGRCASAADRTLWVLDRYGEAAAGGLTASLVTLLVFEQGPNLSRAAIVAGLEAARAAGLAGGTDDAWSITAAGRARLAALPPLPA